MISMIRDMISGACVALLVGALALGVPVAGPESVSTATVSAPDRSYTAPDTEPFYAVYVDAEDIDPETGEPLTLQGVAIRALIDHGAMGAVNDGADSFVYVRVGTVADFVTGTVTATAFGIRICTDGDDGRCTGTEFDPWAPNM